MALNGREFKPALFRADYLQHKAVCGCDTGDFVSVVLLAANGIDFLRE